MCSTYLVVKGGERKKEVSEMNINVKTLGEFKAGEKFKDQVVELGECVAGFLMLIVIFFYLLYDLAIDSDKRRILKEDLKKDWQNWRKGI